MTITYVRYGLFGLAVVVFVGWVATLSQMATVMELLRGHVTRLGGSPNGLLQGLARDEREAEYRRQIGAMGLRAAGWFAAMAVLVVTMIVIGR